MIAKKRLLPALAAIMLILAMMPVASWQVYADGATEISSIDVEISRPAAGDSLEDNSNVSVTGNGFSVTRIEWCEDYGYDDDNNIVPEEDIDHQGEHGIFNPKFQYSLIISLEADAEHYFPCQSISSSNLLRKDIISINTGIITSTRDLSDDKKTTTFVIRVINASMAMNVTPPPVGEETAPEVSLPEFESSWYTVSGAEWCDANWENVSETRTFAEGEEGYMIVHLQANDNLYYIYDPSKVYVAPSSGRFIAVSNKTTADKVDILLAVTAGDSGGDDEGCPQGGEHEWVLVYHKATFTDYGYQTAECSKCGAESEGVAIGGCPVDTVTLAKTSYTYTGAAIKPEVTLSSKDGQLSKEYYTVAYSNNVNAGTATVKVTLQGEFYEGTKSLNFKINKASVAKATVSGLKAKVYTGKALTQAPVVKVGSRTLKNGTDYTVSYKNNKAIGMATMTITGKGNYTGTISKNFKIIPKGTYFTKFVPAKGAITAYWNKQATQTTGYVLQYALNSSFTSGAKKVVISRNTKYAYKATGLKSGKGYYLRVCTYKKVGTKYYYSSWSKVKYVTTK